MAKFIKLTAWDAPVWINVAHIESFGADPGVTAGGLNDACRARVFLASYGEDERLRVKEAPEEILALIASPEQGAGQ